MKKIIYNFLTILISVLFSIIVIEFFVRTVVDDGMNLDIEMLKYAKNLKKISKNHEVGIEHMKNKKSKLMGVKINLNEKGLRGNSIIPGKPKILLLGDSMTFGWGSKITFSSILQNNLPNFQVLNAGIGNTNTNMQINNFFYNLKDIDEIKFIILNFFVNDLEDIKIVKPNFITKNFYSYTFIRAKFIEFQIKNNFKRNWQGFYKDSFYNDEILNKTFMNINKLKNFCEKNSIKLVIHNLPELRNLKNYKFQNETLIIKNFAIKNNIPYYDSIEVLKNEDEQTLWVTKTDFHGNEKANILIGNYLFNKIKWKY